MSSPHDKRAFTLLELLAVILIITVVSLATIPAIRAISSTGLQTASRHVSNTMMLARQYAITNRVKTRFCVSVYGTPTGITANDICRAYTVCAAVTDTTVSSSTYGQIISWRPLMEWQFLPPGIVFSDINTTSYDPSSLASNGIPTRGVITNRLYGSSTSINDKWMYFDNAIISNATMVVNVSNSTTANWQTYISTVEFQPNGSITSGSGSVNGTAGVNSPPLGGIRLIQGMVVSSNGGPSSSPTILCNSTNSWVYIEFNAYTGRIRTRTSDTYAP